MEPRSGTRRSLVTGIATVLLATACAAGEDAGNQDGETSGDGRVLAATSTAGASDERAARGPDGGSAAYARDGSPSPGRRTGSRAASHTLLAGAALCMAYGDFTSTGGTDRLLARMTEDVVLADAVLGTSLVGRTAVREYLESGALDGFDSTECGAIVHVGSWAAGAYTMHNSTSDQTVTGIAAMRVTDGRVDRQVNHYSVSTGAVSTPKRAAHHPILDYCRAWDGGAEPNEVLPFLAAEPVIDAAGTTLVGHAEIRSYLEDVFPYVTNDCSEVAVVHGPHVAATHTLGTASGTASEGISIVRLGDGGAVEAHAVYVG
jgi:hypothetical protein